VSICPDLWPEKNPLGLCYWQLSNKLRFPRQKRESAFWECWQKLPIFANGLFRGSAGQPSSGLYANEEGQRAGGPFPLEMFLQNEESNAERSKQMRPFVEKDRI
jgi:hypothetical protein